MRELVHERELDLVDDGGVRYGSARVYAEPQQGGTWEAWIEFVSADGAQSVRTDRETTQSNLEGVAYWATGLEPTYLEGALDRALRRASPDEPVSPAPPPSGPAVVRFRLVSADPTAPLRLMATRTLVPGTRRYIHNGGVIVYMGAAQADPTPSVYDFVAQCGSDNSAAIMANRIWSDLHGVGARLEVEGAEVPLHNAAIKDALLGALTR